MTFDGVHAQRDPGRIECAEPGALLLLAIEPRQLHDRHHLVAQRLAIALQSLRAVLARLAGGNADLDQLFVGKQAHRLRCTEQRAPVEMGARHCMNLTLAVPRAARRTTQCVAGFLHQQWLVAPDGVQRPQAFLQVQAELVQAQLHRSWVLLRPPTPQPTAAWSGRRCRSASRDTATPPPALSPAPRIRCS